MNLLSNSRWDSSSKIGSWPFSQTSPFCSMRDAFSQQSGNWASSAWKTMDQTAHWRHLFLARPYNVHSYRNLSRCALEGKAFLQRNLAGTQRNLALLPGNLVRVSIDFPCQPTNEVFSARQERGQILLFDGLSGVTCMAQPAWRSIIGKRPYQHYSSGG